MLPKLPKSGRLFVRKHQIKLQLLGVLLFACLHGLVWLVITPPWQHYDEPGHFEKVYLLAKNLRPPEIGEYDVWARIHIQESMIANGFYEHGLNIPPREAIGNWDYLGPQQAGTPSLHHSLAAIPVRLIMASPGSGDVTLMLYAARLVSLGEFLLTLVFAFLLMRRFCQPTSALPALTALAIAVTPGVVDLMTAVNDDVSAILFFTIYLWLGVVILQKFPHWQAWLALPVWGLSAIACFYSKNTVLWALPLLAVLPFLWAIKRTHGWWRWAWFLPASLTLTLLAGLCLDFGDARSWYKSTSQNTPTSVLHPKAPYGKRALQIEPGSWISQPVVINQTQGTKYSLGFWVWADNPTNLQINIRAEYGTFSIGDVQVNQKEPQLQRLKAETAGKRIILEIRNNGNAPVYLDGMIWGEGWFPATVTPLFHNAEMSFLEWDGVSFVNKLDNPSGEKTWFTLRSWLNNRLKEHGNFYLSPATSISALGDAESVSIVAQTLARVYQTFWGYFGWAHIKSSGLYYYGIGLFLIISLFGAILRASRQISKLSKYQFELYWLGLAGLLVSLTVLLRATSAINDVTPFIPVARYLYPTLVFLFGVLTYGWFWYYNIHKPTRPFVLAGTIIFIVLVMLSGLVSVLNFYYFYI
ncbi:MAG TPA: hypothetical protein PK299_09710 [Anaerolineales bacterium]|nr:hypothetical protein [Anaerolineales bacterium]